MKKYLPIILLIVIGCKTNSHVVQSSDISSAEFKPQYIPGPKALVYKTKANYFNFIPVMLSDDKSKIVSYPHPKDVKNGDVFQTPVQLHNQYLLDKRGIYTNVAFIKMTYEEYSVLKDAPTPEDLFKLIIDKDPLTELIDCGNITKMSDPEKQLNALIDSGKLRSTCKTIK